MVRALQENVASLHQQLAERTLSSAEKRVAAPRGNEHALMTVTQICKHLSISLETWRRWERSGRTPPHVSTPGHRRWRREDIERFAGDVVQPISRGRRRFLAFRRFEYTDLSRTRPSARNTIGVGGLLDAEPLASDPTGRPGEIARSSAHTMEEQGTTGHAASGWRRHRAAVCRQDDVRCGSAATRDHRHCQRHPRLRPSSWRQARRSTCRRLRIAGRR